MWANCSSSWNQPCADRLGGGFQDFNWAIHLSKMLSRGDVCGSDSLGFCSWVWSSDRLVIFRKLILEPPPFRMGRLTVVYCVAVLLRICLGMVIKRRTLFQHVNQGKWGVQIGRASCRERG